jgi:hypothetical protein
MDSPSPLHVFVQVQLSGIEFDYFSIWAFFGLGPKDVCLTVYGIIWLSCSCTVLIYLLGE